MTNVQLTILIVTILGSQWGSLLYLSNRIDKLEGELKSAIQQLTLKVDRLIETVHQIDIRVTKLEERKTA